MDVSRKYIIEEVEFCMFYEEKFILHTKHRYIKNSLLCTLSATDKLCDICECSLVGQGCISHSSNVYEQIHIETIIEEMMDLYNVHVCVCLRAHVHLFMYVSYDSGAI